MDFIIRMVASNLIRTHVTSKIDWEEGHYLTILFAVFGGVQLLVLTIYGLLYRCAQNADDTEKNIKVEKMDQLSVQDISAGRQPQKIVEMQTQREYDASTALSAIKSYFFNLAFIAGFYYWKKDPAQLVVQVFFAPYNLIRTNLFRSYVFHEDLPRPFKSASPFNPMGMLTQLTEAASGQDQGQGQDNSALRNPIGAMFGQANSTTGPSQVPPAPPAPKKKKKKVTSASPSSPAKNVEEEKAGTTAEEKTTSTSAKKKDIKEGAKEGKTKEKRAQGKAKEKKKTE